MADPERDHPALRTTAVVLWAAAAVAVTVLLTSALLLVSGREDQQRLGNVLDIVRIGLSVGVGTGGLFALWLASRRQRSAELTLALQREVSRTTSPTAPSAGSPSSTTRPSNNWGTNARPSASAACTRWNGPHSTTRPCARPWSTSCAAT